MNTDILRGRRLGNLNAESVKYTASTVFDTILVNPVIEINKAHMVMLVSQGIVKKSQGAKCLEGLGNLKIGDELDPILEDVHMNVESQLTKIVGTNIGGQLNLGKSRNDQVSTAIRMALRTYLLKIITNLVEFRLIILGKAEDNLETVMPGYTHLQHAQPTTLAHHLMAYHDSMYRDCERLIESYLRLNISPLGSVALASTSIKIDRNLTAHLLGFDGLIDNSMDAVSSRDFAVEVVSDLALTMTNMSRIAEELVLWSSEEFGILEIPDGFASTSSIMPQKKNAVVAELIRSKTSSVFGDMIAVISILKSLPYSYNIDMQQLTPHLWNSCEITLSSTKVIAGMLDKAIFNEERLADLSKDEVAMATDLADYLAVNNGIPFRTAHLIVGDLVRISIDQKRVFRDVILNELSKTAKQLGGKDVSVSVHLLDKLLDPKKSVESKISIGGPSRSMVLRMIKKGKKNITFTKMWISTRRKKLKSAEKALDKAISEIIGGDSN